MAASSTRVYKVALSAVSVSAAITLIQLKAGATVPLQIIRATCAQSTNTSTTMQRIQLNRKSAAATVTSATPVLCGPVTDPAASAVGGASATGTNASAEGTDSGILFEDVWNMLLPWLYLPAADERDFIDAATICGLKFPAAPAATTIVALLKFVEMA